nr:immunoglobulin light chain junction region [Macaca mulatta]MOX53795.1 immunoglobulin light chain junction region [Macaca mulatta]MOX53934.1 immunoglobulin light chain junction region [Macaca mulatta]MOX54192.1 immunoglobulin light chain junction region [Macaca mulatta]MOX54262.1 immunoglobulin light chain junction region [Macaca mulatta]
CQQGHSIPYTF